MTKSKVKENLCVNDDFYLENHFKLSDFNKKLLSLITDEQSKLINYYNCKDIINNFSAYSFTLIMKIYLKILKRTLNNNSISFSYIKKIIKDVNIYLNDSVKPLDKYRILSELMHFTIQYHLLELNDIDKHERSEDMINYIKYCQYMEMLYNDIFIDTKYSKFLVYDANDVINNIVNNTDNHDMSNTYLIGILKYYQYLNKCFSKYADTFIQEKIITPEKVHGDILNISNEIDDHEAIMASKELLEDFRKILISHEKDCEISLDKLKEFEIL